jgi:hypothetical protein
MKQAGGLEAKRPPAHAAFRQDFDGQGVFFVLLSFKP